MAVNLTLAGLSQTAADNGPDGGADPPSALDDALRYHGAFIAQLRDMMMPIGSIIPYDGLIASLPANWKVCDGTNGTPDLRDRFVMGVSSTRALNSIGGFPDSVVVAHTHTGATAGQSVSHTHSVNDPGHTHAYDKATNPSAKPASSGTAPFVDHAATSTAAATTGITLGAASADHTHAFTTGSTGGTAVGMNIPPYRALNWIKRVS